jgi:serine/threonine-protein kinase
MLDASMAPTVPPDHSDRVLGTWLGTYQVLGGLTTGGQASTYLARAAGSSDLVVVKLIREDLLTQPQAYARLRREAAVGTTLRAGNVARLISAELDGERPYLVFEYVAGLSLGTLTGQRLEEGRPVPPGVVARILSGLLAGLHAVHEARGPDGELLDAVHRDVSPGNVMLSLDGVTKLIDLGLVRASTGTLQTVVGTLMGTPPYIAPELVLYGAGVADRTADIFVASLVGYELLRGQRTMPLGTPLAVAAPILREPVFEDLARTHGALGQVVMRGLALEPSRRWSTARQMGEALRAAAGDALASEREVAAEFAAELARAREYVQAHRAVIADRVAVEQRALESAVFEPTRTGLNTAPVTQVSRPRPTAPPSPELALATSEALAESRPTRVLRKLAAIPASASRSPAAGRPALTPPIVGAMVGALLLAGLVGYGLAPREVVYVAMPGSAEEASGRGEDAERGEASVAPDVMVGVTPEPTQPDAPAAFAGSAADDGPTATPAVGPTASPSPPPVTRSRTVERKATRPVAAERVTEPSPDEAPTRSSPGPDPAVTELRRLRASLQGQEPTNRPEFLAACDRLVAQRDCPGYATAARSARGEGASHQRLTDLLAVVEACLAR